MITSPPQRQIKDSKTAICPLGSIAVGGDVHLRHTELKLVYDFWQNKRLQKQQPLNRRFVDPPEMNDPDPKVERIICSVNSNHHLGGISPTT